MNYVILAGQDSNTIPGLIISELPPITMSPVRNNIIEIDGRDGDIIEDLGFCAYDKEMKIGLSIGYTVDDVIKFFDRIRTENTVVFSNESDKYYKAQITEQIDFERLVRFRTATVKMHVQPGKYLRNETQTFEGAPLTMFDIENKGNVISEPRFSFIGRGLIDFVLDGSLIFTYDFKSNTTFFLDSAKQDVTNSGNLTTNQMNGEFPKFPPGTHSVQIGGTGTVSKIRIDGASRWR